MNITESKVLVYSFAFTFEGIGYSFNVNASTQREAMERLYRGLNSICGELKTELNTAQPEPVH